MGGGVSELYQNTVGSRSGRNRTPSLFSYGSGDNSSITGQNGGSTQAWYASENSPAYSGESSQDEAVLDIFSLFMAMYYLLIEKFGKVKNKKLAAFLSKLAATETINNEDLFNSSEFKTFQKYCKDKSIQQHHGYEVIRRFMTKYFSDSSGVFMKLKTSEWEQYANRFLGNNNLGRILWGF